MDRRASSAAPAARARRRRLVRAVYPCLPAALACAVLSGAGAAASLEDLRACLASNVPQSSAMAVTLASRSPGGREYAHEGQLYWRQTPEGLSQTLLCITSPRDVRGLAYLVHERDSGPTVWAYLPEEERVLRINPQAAATRGRIARTALSYEDLRYLPLNLSQAESEAVTDSLLGSRPVSTVRLALPPGGRSLYERVISFVDQESCVPLKIEFYEKGDRLRKIATAEPDAISRERQISLARSMTIKDLKQQVETELRIEKLEIDGELPDRIFASEYLQRGRCPG